MFLPILAILKPAVIGKGLDGIKWATALELLQPKLLPPIVATLGLLATWQVKAIQKMRARQVKPKYASVVLQNLALMKCKY
jgi:hypothetical protein